VKRNKRCDQSDQDIERAGGQSSHAPNGRLAGANLNPLNNCNSLREARFGEAFLVDHVHILERECSLSMHLAGHINVSPVGDDRGRKDLLAWMPSRLVLRTTMMPLRGTRLAKRGRTTTALTAIEGQRKGREALSAQRQREASTLADFKAEHAALGAKGHQIETEAAPIRYVAELVGSDTDSERAIRWLILMMVLYCDPLAIA
jgi:hypothetical protein